MSQLAVREFHNLEVVTSILTRRTFSKSWFMHWLSERVEQCAQDAILQPLWRC